MERDRRADRPTDDARDSPEAADVDGGTPSTGAVAQPAPATNDDPEFERQMSVGREVMRVHRNVLAALAR